MWCDPLCHAETVKLSWFLNIAAVVTPVDLLLDFCSWIQAHTQAHFLLVTVLP